MKLTVLLLLVLGSLCAQPPQPPKQIQRNHITFRTIGPREDPDFQEFVKSIQDGLKPWLISQAPSQPQDYSWMVAVTMSGWNKATVEIQATSVPERFAKTGNYSHGKTVKGCIDPKSVVKDMTDFMEDLPKRLEKFQSHKY